MPQRGIAKTVLETLTEHIGIHVSAQSLKDLMGEKARDIDERQLGQALNTLRSNEIIDRVGRGIYVYRGARPIKGEGSHLFETVGNLEDGSVLVRSDENNFYVLTTLEQHYNRKDPTT